MITPKASGEITVEVTNKHGSAWSSAGRVDLYDLPSCAVDLTGLPRPVMSGVPAVTLPRVLHAMPPVPTVSTAGHAVPRIELPSLAPVADAVSVMRSVSYPFQRLAASSPPVHPNLGPLASRTTDCVTQIFDDAREQLRDHVAQQVAAALRLGGTTP